MDDENIKKQLSKAFDDFEEMPNAMLFSNINAKLNETYSVEKQRNNYRKTGIAFVFLVLISIGFSYYTLKKSNSYHVRENALKIKSFANSIKNEPISLKHSPFEKKPYNIKKIEPISVQNQIEIDERLTGNRNRNGFLNENSTYFLKKNQKIEASNPFDSILKTTNNQIISKTKSKFAVADFHPKTNKLIQNNNLMYESSLSSENQNINTSILSTKMVFEGKTSHSEDIEEIETKSVALIEGKIWTKLANNLANKKLPTLLKLKIPIDLPKINKTTPLGFEFWVNPFLGFQKIEATEAGMANIQNITEQKIGFQDRMGYILNAALVLNWAKQSRLRLGVSYRNMFQKVGYELATDVYEIVQVGNAQTVLIRKGTPYTEQKRHQMIGIKAERQYFLQLNTPTRFYGNLGLEYNKALADKTQLLFINSSFGFDFAIAPKVRFQIEPNYSYAILGTTDTRNNVNITPNHIGVRVGLLYELRK